MLFRNSAVALPATVLVAVIGLLLLASLAQSASAQEPTQTVTEPTPPAAPELVSVDDRLTWVDKSDNEDGFRILIDVNGVEHVFEVGPNVTVFEYPDDLLPICGDTRWRLSAFNEAGETSSGRWRRIAECPGWGSTPEPEILPETGSGQLPEAEFPSVFVSVIVGMLGLALVLFTTLRLRKG